MDERVWQQPNKPGFTKTGCGWIWHTDPSLPTPGLGVVHPVMSRCVLFRKAGSGEHEGLSLHVL